MDDGVDDFEFYVLPHKVRERVRVYRRARGRLRRELIQKSDVVCLDEIRRFDESTRHGTRLFARDYKA